MNDNLVNGVDVVGDMTPDQMGYFRPFAGWSSYRSPVYSLYMCGGFYHPGGGVHAGAAANAATVIVEDFKPSRWWEDRGLMRAANPPGDRPAGELWKFLPTSNRWLLYPGVERIRWWTPRPPR